MTSWPHALADVRNEPYMLIVTGGLNTTRNQEACDANNTPVPGLYAVGTLLRRPAAPRGRGALPPFPREARHRLLDHVEQCLLGIDAKLLVDVRDVRSRRTVRDAERPLDVG